VSDCTRLAALDLDKTVNLPRYGIGVIDEIEYNSKSNELRVSGRV
jgi:hypothetical protein